MHRVLDTPNLRLERRASLEALEEIAPAWNALACEVDAGTPFSTWAWVHAHVRHRLAEDETFACHLAWRDEELVGVLPLVRRGRVVRVPADFHTLSGAPLLAPASREAVLAALLANVEHTERGIMSVELGTLQPGSALPEALEEVPGPAFVAPDRTGRRVRVRGSWEAGRRGLSRSFRRSLRRCRARAERKGGVLRGLSGECVDPSFLDDFLVLEASGWKGRCGDPIAGDPISTAFYRAAVHGFADAGWLRWHTLEIGDRVAAAHLGVRVGRQLTLLKIAYDESFANLAPGNVLFDALLERVFEDHTVDTVDCVTDMPWHDRWRLERYVYRKARFHPPRAAALLRGALPSWVRAQGRRLKAALATLSHRASPEGAASAGLWAEQERRDADRRLAGARPDGDPAIHRLA